MGKNLWLFDIDGTLVNINDLHLKTYKKTYRHNGIELPDEIILSTFGMTEEEMHKKVFKKLKLHHNEALIRKIKNEHVKNIVESLNSLNHIEPLDGVVKFLKYLSRNKEYICVVTGNLKQSAKLILKKSNLIGYFSFLSCDNGKKTRKQVVKEAINAAKKRKYKFKKIIVIGDTTKDIEAVKYVKVLTVAVATGSDSFKKLQKSKPDIMLKSLKDYRLIFKELGG